MDVAEQDMADVVAIAILGVGPPGDPDSCLIDETQWLSPTSSRDVQDIRELV